MDYTATLHTFETREHRRKTAGGPSICLQRRASPGGEIIECDDKMGGFCRPLDGLRAKLHSRRVGRRKARLARFHDLFVRRAGGETQIGSD